MNINGGLEIFKFMSSWEEIFMTNIKLSPELGKMQETYIEVSILLCAMSLRLKKSAWQRQDIACVSNNLFICDREGVISGKSDNPMK